MIKYKYNIMKSRDASLESISEESGFIIYLNNFLLQYRSTRQNIQKHSEIHSWRRTVYCVIGKDTSKFYLEFLID